ncbi:flagella synthesis protein FlgN [Shewanella algidipiscicola]|uniref:Flagellar protein FlgN n=1 Tax=Shewanella algidipiscicola TaxID=614070 RepID=A0ABQ4PFN9_9GAMM|nr:flagellar protein FlgN [Shewanella algidipiscicola]GIU46243.1 flagellar protein FlgN [Shewanella algidipiscicola]
MNSIIDIIANQHTLLNDLKRLIEAEKVALIAQSADELLTLATDKAKLLDEIKAVDVRLSEHPDSGKLSSDPKLQKLVEITKQVLAQCKTLNAQNATLIEHSMASINRFSQALQASRNASSLTYDGKGKTSTISTLGNNLKA